MGGKPTDHTGKTFGRLKVIAYARSNGMKAYWTCKCSCGTEIDVRADHLVYGKIVSCGCYQKEVFNNRKHGMSYSPEYRVWESLKSRCNNPDDKAFVNYGGRGIKYSSEWESFEAFSMDMGPRPSKNHSIERSDVNGDYCKENCYWIEGRSVQNFNKRKPKNNSSGRTGVGMRRGKWFSVICKDRKVKFLGTFDTYEKACAARELAEIELFGFAKE